MTAVAFKCALLPLSSWFVKVSSVPRAPVAIATILSALHVKGGIYLFIRFQSVFGELIPAEFYVAVGVVTGIMTISMVIIFLAAVRINKNGVTHTSEKTTFSDLKKLLQK